VCVDEAQAFSKQDMLFNETSDFGVRGNRCRRKIRQELEDPTTLTQRSERQLADHHRMLDN